MNRYISIFKISVVSTIGVLTLSSCQSKAESKGTETDTIPHIKVIEKIDTTINIKNMEYPTVTNTFETFDFETYEQRPPADANGYRNSTYIQHFPNGIVTIMDKAAEANGGGFYCQIYYPESPFCVLKIYYVNGNIKEKGLTYVQGFDKGIWHEFDPSGKLVKDTNYDKPFIFTFEDVAKYCEQNGIKIEKGYESLEGKGVKGSFITYIFRDCNAKACKWTIRYRIRDPQAPQGITEKTVILDGKTGKVISKSQVPYYIFKE